MVELRSESLSRIGVSQKELDNLRTALTLFDELCRDLSNVGQELEDANTSRSSNDKPTVVNLELIRLERELENDVRQYLKDAALTRPKDR